MDRRDPVANEIASGERFAFGANWARFLSLVTPDRISSAEESLKLMFGLDSFAGLRFVDIGCGSGLFSLAARNLGAEVHSCDYDPESVSCAVALRERYRPGDTEWVIEQGSILDEDYVGGIGTFDLVYSWGVLHHTGAMWSALRQAESLANPNALLFISIYNDQGPMSTVWTKVKRAYVSGNHLERRAIEAAAYVYLVAPSKLYRRFSGRGSQSPRGMDVNTDLVDWVGGFPFEVAKPEEIIDFYQDLGWNLKRLKTVAGRIGCNEFVFARTDG